MKTILAGSGNQVVDNDERRIDLNEYENCYQCGDEFCTDDLIEGRYVGRRHSMVCAGCLKDFHLEYRCNACEDDFVVVGIPAQCPKCQSWNIEHGLNFVNILIRQKQEKELARLEAEPLQLPVAIAQVQLTL